MLRNRKTTPVKSSDRPSRLDKSNLWMPHISVLWVIKDTKIECDFIMIMVHAACTTVDIPTFGFILTRETTAQVTQSHHGCSSSCACSWHWTLRKDDNTCDGSMSAESSLGSLERMLFSACFCGTSPCESWLGPGLMPANVLGKMSSFFCLQHTSTSEAASTYTKCSNALYQQCSATFAPATG